MADLLQDASVWLGRVLARHASQPVIYRRGTHDVRVQATIGRTAFEALNASGALVESETRDFLIDADALLIPSGKITPQSGDRILEERGRQTFTFEVMPIETDGRCYRPADAYHGKLRIHTRELSVA